MLAGFASVIRTLIFSLAALALALPAQAQRRGFDPGTAQAPPGLSPAEADIWPFPLPDPQSWWDEKRLQAPEAADPLAGRRIGRKEALAPVDNGVDPIAYRLWGLMPLQTQLLAPGELIIEVWTKPSRSVRQTVTRVTVRRDGKAFVQGRAGEACCEAGIARRVGFDAELPAGAAQAFLALRDHLAWNAPRNVLVLEEGSEPAVCADGTAYDLTLAVGGRSRSIRRACDNAEIGQAADILEPLLRAALGHEPRFDIVFRNRIDFAAARSAYQGLIQGGGQLKADPLSRPQAPGLELTPTADEASTPN